MNGNLAAMMTSASKLATIAAWRKASPVSSSVELRAELPRVPAEVLHCGRGIENHILCHAVSHCNIRVRNERPGQRKRCSPQRRRDWDDAARLVQPVENSSNHLAI